MAVVMCFRVHYHFEGPNGKKSSDDLTNYVQAADGAYDTIKAVLSSNSKLRGSSHALVIDAVINTMAVNCLA